MARPTHIHDLPEHSSHDTLLSINAAALLMEGSELLESAATLVAKAGALSDTYGDEYSVRKIGDFVEVRRLKSGEEAVNAVTYAQKSWDQRKEQYDRIKSYEAFPEGEHRLSLWDLNNWARSEDLPRVTETEYSGLRPVPENSDEEE